MEKIDVAKYNISRLVHTEPKTLNEKAVLKDLGMSSFSRAAALKILLEILNVIVMVEKRKENENHE